MTANVKDPYRTLGLGHGATEEEVKRAYRALAKRHHPDAAKGSVARFLEIQAAYEMLLGSPAQGAPLGRPVSRRPARPSDGGSQHADSGDGGGRHADRGDGAARTADRSDGGGQHADHADRGDASAARGAATGRRRREAGRRRATPGSTSYDEAQEVREPEWHGASWYGSTSGTYWTINPREYADPRKHGPEYLARTRRGAPGYRPPEADSREDPESDAAAQHGPGQAPPPRPSDSQNHGPASGSRTTRPRSRSAAPAEHRQSAPSAVKRQPGAGGPGLGARGALAVLGWLGPALALAGWAGFPEGLLATLPIQVAGLALLAARPRLAWAGLGGGIALAAAGFPIVAVVAALGDRIAPGGPAPAPAVVLAALAWCAGALLLGSGRLVRYPWRQIG